MGGEFEIIEYANYVLGLLIDDWSAVGMCSKVGHAR
jgi:hypothetical protein